MYGESWSICSGRSCRLPLQYLPVLQTAAAANCPLVRGGGEIGGGVEGEEGKWH